MLLASSSSQGQRLKALPWTPVSVVLCRNLVVRIDDLVYDWLILYTIGLFSIVGYADKLVGYADDSTLVAVIPKPSDKPCVEASILRISRLSRDHWCMAVISSMTKSVVASKSHTPFLSHGSLALERNY